MDGVIRYTLQPVAVAVDTGRLTRVIITIRAAAGHYCRTTIDYGMTIAII